MYQEHFGLREPPFRITPRAEIFFAGGKRGATLEALLYAVTHDEGMVKVSGETGSGKTMLCQALIHWLPEGFTAVHPAGPPLSREELLFTIADELGLPVTGNRVGRLVRALQERLGELQDEDRHVVLLLDEAHTIPDDALEQLRQLSNLEANRRKLLRIVLFGQPELDLRLMQSDMRQFRERITHNFALEPLGRDDVAAYLAFRMRAAGHQGASPFSAAAVQLIARHSAGLTRRIDVLADKALQAAYAAGSRQIDLREAKAAVRDAQFPPIQGAKALRPAWIGLAAAGIVAGAAALHFTGLAFRSTPAADRLTEEAPAMSLAAVAPAAAEPLVAPEPQNVRPAPEPPPDTTAVRQPEMTAPVAPPPAGADESGFGPLTRALLADSAAWLREAPGKRHFIQLTQADAAQADAIETFLTTHAARLDQQHPLRAYRSALSGRDRLGIIYGDFATPAQAAAALARLPADLRAAGPYVRTVDKLR
ncbi:MAG: AAA family ATPase [Rhodocyclaceae bacterium]|nr:AAA family ATPase [Rhodocyclaceae bacterium]